MRILLALTIVLLAAGTGTVALVTGGRASDVTVAADPSAQDGQSSPRLHPVQIRRPDGPPRVITPLTGRDGGQIEATCASCHATRPADATVRVGEDLDEFHQGLTVQHGSLTCLSCHNSSDYDTLRLADGAKVEFPDVMTLCAQCHGPQYRDYTHGTHGGMTGFWDRTKGPRQRNNCVDCHDPHAPAFRGFQPAPGPRDRFLTPPGHPEINAARSSGGSHGHE